MTWAISPIRSVKTTTNSQRSHGHQIYSSIPMKSPEKLATSWKNSPTTWFNGPSEVPLNCLMSGPSAVSIGKMSPGGQFDPDFPLWNGDLPVMFVDL